MPQLATRELTMASRPQLLRRTHASQETNAELWLDAMLEL